MEMREVRVRDQWVEELGTCKHYFVMCSNKRIAI